MTAPRGIKQKNTGLGRATEQMAMHHNVGRRIPGRYARKIPPALIPSLARELSHREF